MRGPSLRRQGTEQTGFCRPTFPLDEKNDKAACRGFRPAARAVTVKAGYAVTQPKATVPN